MSSIRVSLPEFKVRSSTFVFALSPSVSVLWSRSPVVPWSGSPYALRASRRPRQLFSAPTPSRPTADQRPQVAGSGTSERSLK